MGGRPAYDAEFDARPLTTPWNKQWFRDQLPPLDRPFLALYPDGTIVVVKHSFVDQNGHSMSNPIGWQELPPVYDYEKT